MKRQKPKQLNLVSEASRYSVSTFELSARMKVFSKPRQCWMGVLLGVEWSHRS